MMVAFTNTGIDMGMREKYSMPIIFIKLNAQKWLDGEKHNFWLSRTGWGSVCVWERDKIIE